MNLARKVVGIVLVFSAYTCCLSAAERGNVNGKNLRSMRYTSRTKDRAIVWQKELRSKLAGLLKIDDLLSSKTPIPFNPKTISSEKRAKYVFHEMEINSTRARRIKIVLTLPTNLKGPRPAVIAISGHGGTRHTCYEKASYSRFARVLAEKGHVTISTSVSRHKVYEKGRTLMGERLWDLMRCVDFLASLKEVDSQRIGCAGNSLGGEMVMWLGAMDQRVGANVSSSFLTRMDQMEKNHCMCWKFPGLRQLADFADIYSLTAPRALLCQNGLKEPPSQFPVSLAREALKEIEPIYADFKRSENLVHVAHKAGHAIDLPTLLAFFDKHLERRNNGTPTNARAEQWKLVWSDEFNREGLPDKTKWDYEEGFVRNREMQYYTRARKENARVEKGMLVIEGRKEKFRNPKYKSGSKRWNEQRQFASYTAASLITLSKADWKYGRIEVRARLPRGKGIWPAIWTLGTSRTSIGWPRCGEIDIMEFVGKDPNRVHANAHYAVNGKHRSSGGKLKTDKPYDDFHIYAVEWREDRMDFFFDKTKYHTFIIDKAGKGADNPFRKPHYLLMNLALGGSWGGPIDDTVLPQKYLIDYVRVYKPGDASPKPTTAKMVPLMDGKTLDGWHAVGSGKWTVEDGAFVGRAKKARLYGLLVSDKVYENFIVSFSFKCLAGDSGFYIRTIMEKPDKAKGLQVQVGLPGSGAGGIYESYGRKWLDKPTAAEEKKILKADGWNRMTISASGGDVVVHVNGAKTAELKNDKGRPKGHFALQMHSGNVMHVMFKDIKIRDLP